MLFSPVLLEYLKERKSLSSSFPHITVHSTVGIGDTAPPILS
jgi:hypothetical protein